MRPSVLVLSVLTSALLTGCTAGAALQTTAARGPLDTGDTGACVLDRHAELPAPGAPGQVGPKEVIKAAEPGAACGDVAAADVLAGPEAGRVESGDLDELRGFAACMRAAVPRPGWRVPAGGRLVSTPGRGIGLAETDSARPR